MSRFLCDFGMDNNGMKMFPRNMNLDVDFNCNDRFDVEKIAFVSNNNNNLFFKFCQQK